jgi:uncharacterized protein (TIGR00369 family)
MSQPARLPSDPGRDVAATAPRHRSYTWEDPGITAAAARTLAGNAFFDELTRGQLPVPPVAQTLGFTAVHIRDGVARFELDPAEFHYNPIGSVHGGVIATLCDSACGCAVHSMLPAGAYYTSLDLTVKFLRPVSAATGRMTCEGTVLQLGARSALAQAKLTGPDGKLHAHATSSCMIFRPSAG